MDCCCPLYSLHFIVLVLCCRCSCFFFFPFLVLLSRFIVPSIRSLILSILCQDRVFLYDKRSSLWIGKNYIFMSSLIASLILSKISGQLIVFNLRYLKSHGRRPPFSWEQRRDLRRLHLLGYEQISFHGFYIFRNPSK